MFAWLRNAFESWMDYPKQPGDLLSGRYDVCSLLGMGSYGLTYLCLDRHSGQEVAVKLPRPSKRAKAVQLLQREAHIMRQMEHPNIPKLLESVEHSNGIVVVMEYISGMTLEELIFEQERSFTEQECVVYILELMERVLYVHERGYIHRDIRIPNVIHREEALPDRLWSCSGGGRATGGCIYRIHAGKARTRATGCRRLQRFVRCRTFNAFYAV